MKKWIFALLAVLLLLAACTYLFIPSDMALQNHVRVSANRNSVYRALTDERLVQQWWPGSHQNAAEPEGQIVVSQGDFRYSISPAPFDVVRVRIDKGAAPVQSLITILSVRRDSALVMWKAETQVRGGLFARLQNYLLAHRLKREMAGVLTRLQQFVQSEKNVYGFTVARNKVDDTLLVSTKVLDTAKPTVETYYGLIKKLRSYIAAKGAQETDYPMLSIRSVENKQYETMVAIPVNKVVPDQEPLLAKRMVPGNILVVEVQGGPATIEEALRQLDFYLAEHNMTSPALPFQMLVTDRLAEHDTTKWITRLYYPVL
jgi:hypothetical protein